MRTTKIGLLVAIALAILMVTVFSLNQEQPFWERKAQYEVHFSRTGGLQTGAPVSLSGVTIGTVVEMRFPPDPAASYIQVLINVKGDLAPRIREDTVASIRTLGLLGDRYIELSAGTPESPPVSPGGLIASIDPVEIEALVGQGGDIVTNIVEVTASFKDVLGSTQRGEGLLGATLGNLDRAISDLAEVAAKLDRGQGTLGKLVNDPSLYHDTKALLGGARKSWLLRFFGGGGSAPTPDAPPPTDAPAGDRGRP